MIIYEGYYGAVPLGTEDSIQHYGVLGMKWGQRKFQNKDGTLTAAGKRHERKTGEHGYQYKSFTTKHFDRKAIRRAKKAMAQLNKAKTMTGKKRLKQAEKAKNTMLKAEKFKRYADRSREMDKREQQYAKNHSAKGNIASRILTNGQVGGKAYQQYVSMLGAQNQKKRLTKEKVAAAVLSRAGGRLGSTIAKQVYVRNGRINRSLNAYAKETDRAATTRKKKRR